MPAEFVSGNGGFIEVVPDGGFVAVRLDIAKWTLRHTSRLTENTHSGVSSTNFEHVVYHNEWTAEIPFDVENPPENLMEEGDKITVYFNRGESGDFWTLTLTSLETLEEVDDNSQDIVRIAASGKGGSLS